MKKFLSTVFLLALCCNVLLAQPRAVGLRIGGTGEFSYQHSFNSDGFLEADLGVNYAKYSGGLLNGTYNFIFADVRQFNFYAGPGAHIGFYYKDGMSDPASSGKIKATFALGISGQIGGEYLFKKIPLLLSVDWRPTWSIVGNVFDPSSFCIGVRYYLQ